MKILIASDIHGRVERMKMLKERIAEFQPDRIFLLGDYLYNGPRNGVPNDYEPMEVSKMLNQYASKIIGVRGNCDSRVDGMLLAFPLEDSPRFEMDGHFFDLYHGDEYSIALLKAQKGDILVSGHTHIQVLEKKDGMIWLNPGSISFPKGGNEASYATIEDDLITIRKVVDASPIKELSID